MSIWFMRDNHTFARLDTLSVDAAMDRLEVLVDAEGGYGFVGTCNVTPSVTIQWRPGEPWRQRIRALLATHEVECAVCEDNTDGR